MKTGFVYFMVNKYGNVLYCGVTNDLARRVAEHFAKVNEGFTEKYNCTKLVYYEELPSFDLAIAREKQIKNWKREWKNALVDEFNPQWDDLSESIGVDDDLIEAVKEYYKERGGKF